MIIQVQSGTTSWESCPGGVAKPGYVLFTGSFVYDVDGVTALMVWDAALGNVRAMTAAEISALPAQRQATRDAQEPDLSTLRDQAQAAFDSNTTYLAISSPTNAQVAAQVKALTQQQQKIIKALARLAVRTLS